MRFGFSLVLLAVGVAGSACKPGRGSQGGKVPSRTVKVSGADSMINACQRWAEEFTNARGGASIEVNGGGSGSGITALTNGMANIAALIRPFKPSELEKFKARWGREPLPVLVGYHALAVIVHRDNSLNGLSLEELSEVFGDGGNIDRWEQLGVGGLGDIVRLGPQSYTQQEFFRRLVFGSGNDSRNHRDFKPGGRDFGGSRELADACGANPRAAGYVSIPYVNGNVRALALSAKKGEKQIGFTEGAVRDDSYPLTTRLYLCTNGVPSPEVDSFVQFVLGPGGQKALREIGFVPLGSNVPSSRN